MTLENLKNQKDYGNLDLDKLLELEKVKLESNKVKLEKTKVELEIELLKKRKQIKTKNTPSCVEDNKNTPSCVEDNKNTPLCDKDTKKENYQEREEYYHEYIQHLLLSPLYCNQYNT